MTDQQVTLSERRAGWDDAVELVRYELEYARVHCPELVDGIDHVLCEMEKVHRAY